MTTNVRDSRLLLPPPVIYTLIAPITPPSLRVAAVLQTKADLILPI